MDAAHLKVDMDIAAIPYPSPKILSRRVGPHADCTVVHLCLLFSKVENSKLLKSEKIKILEKNLQLMSDSVRTVQLTAGAFSAKRSSPASVAAPNKKSKCTQGELNFLKQECSALKAMVPQDDIKRRVSSTQASVASADLLITPMSLPHATQKKLNRQLHCRKSLPNGTFAHYYVAETTSMDANYGATTLMAKDIEDIVPLPLLTAVCKKFGINKTGDSTQLGFSLAHRLMSNMSDNMTADGLVNQTDEDQADEDQADEDTEQADEVDEDDFDD